MGRVNWGEGRAVQPWVFDRSNSVAFVRRSCGAKKRLRGADMERQGANRRKIRWIATGAIGGFAAAGLFFRLGGAASNGCNFLAVAGWVASEVLRMVLLLGEGRAVLVSVCEVSRVLEYLLQMGACLWRLHQVVAG